MFLARIKIYYKSYIKFEHLISVDNNVTNGEFTTVTSRGRKAGTWKNVFKDYY